MPHGGGSAPSTQRWPRVLAPSGSSRRARAGTSAAWALWLLTFGGQRTYLTHYVTTLGHTIYVPDGFERRHPDRAWQVLRHEMVHVTQFERWGWPLMVLVYGFVPLPAFLAWGRARLEWEAYRETLRAVAMSEGIRAARRRKLHRHLVARFTGPDYGWMWPFPRTVQRWIDEALDEIEAAGRGRAPG